VDVKCILGDPGLHSDLVEDVDCEFGRVVDLVKRGYCLKRQDWVNGSVDIAVAEAEVDENNSVPGIDATDQEKIEFLTNKVVSLEERVKYLEGLLNIRGETVKETEKSKETEAATKTKRKKNGVRPPREVGHQNEDDAEKKRNNNKKMIQKTMWTTVIKRVKIRKPMKNSHKKKRNNKKKMIQKTMWTSVLKRVKIQKPMK
ncbi:unnamed protein product, partial [Brassica napus]